MFGVLSAKIANKLANESLKRAAAREIAHYLSALKRELKLQKMAESGKGSNDAAPK
jgi:hypothetical protein